VIYTLVAFAIIGAVLAFAKPKIEELQDRAIVEQSISIMKEIDSVIKEIGVPGNKRVLDLSIKKGVFKISGGTNELVFEIEGRSEYSEPGKEIADGNLLIKTEKKNEMSVVTITREYGLLDLRYNGNDEDKVLSAASTPYKLTISSEEDGGKIINLLVE